VSQAKYTNLVSYRPIGKGGIYFNVIAFIKGVYLRDLPPLKLLVLIQK